MSAATTMSASPPSMLPITAPTGNSLFFLHSNNYRLHAVKSIHSFSHAWI